VKDRSDSKVKPEEDKQKVALINFSNARTLLKYANDTVKTGDRQLTTEFRQPESRHILLNVNEQRQRQI
jgi:hypothetical protein